MNGFGAGLTPGQTGELIILLKTRFQKHMHRHQGLEWAEIQERLHSDPGKLRSLSEMERTGGEPDVIDRNSGNSAYYFYDCAAESPSGRRSVCYDREALESRKENQPRNSAVDMAAAMGVSILTEEQYRYLQTFGTFDAKTSGWLQTPAEVRKLGGALFGDFRYGRTFVYHNGAQSYYAARGFRAILQL